MVKSKMTRAEAFQRMVKQYRDAGEPWPTDTKTIAGWLVRNGVWRASRKSEIDLLAPELSRALREEFFTDPQGRRVRRKHAVPELVQAKDGTHRQMTIWVDMDATDVPKADHAKRMKSAFQLRRGQVVGDCRQLKCDLDSFNDNYNSGPRIRMLWDFTEDLRELEQSTEYGATNS